MPTVKKLSFNRHLSLFFVAILFLWSLIPTVPIVLAEGNEEKKVDIPPFPEEKMQAKSAYLINADNGEVLYAKNEEEIMQPASLTKVMTLLLTNERLQEKAISLEDEVTISSNAWQTGGSSMYLEVGTVYTVDELIKGTAVVSGNDASVSLAEHVNGEVSSFIEDMNHKASELGMNNTTFQTVHGFPKNGAKDLTTAKDMAILGKYYIQTYPDMLSIHSLTSYKAKQFPKGRNIPAFIEQPNNNTLLTEYEGMDGLKTGFSDYYNFIGTAKRGEIRLIVVVMGAESANKRMNTASALLDYGFSQYKTYEAAKKGDVIDTLTVYKAIDIRETEVELAENVTYGINIRDEADVIIDNQIPDYLEGGLKKGDVIGKQVVTLHGETLAESDIIVTEDLPKTNWFLSIFHHIALLFSQLLNKVGDLL